MGALTAGLVRAAQLAGAELRTGVEAIAVQAGPGGVQVETAAGETVAGETVAGESAAGETFVGTYLLANVAPSVLAALLAIRRRFRRPRVHS